MNYTVFQRDDDASRSLTEQFHRLAAQYGMVPDESDPDLIVSIGGDGTLLKAFHHYQGHLDRASFVGVHTGHLGFFADWMPSELEELVALMNAPAEESKARTVLYPLVEVQIEGANGTETYLAMNEFTIKGLDATLVAELHINNELFEMFRGDGICISTPCGSTAYNKSLGGALLHPSIEALQIAEIASINNRVYRTLGSSMVLPKHHHCDIIPREDMKLYLSVDYVQFGVSGAVSIRCRVAPQKVRFARYRPFPFWSRVKEAFIGKL